MASSEHELFPDLGMEIQHIEQYVGLWAIEEGAFRRALASIANPEILRSHIAAASEVRNRYGPGRYSVEDRVATIDVVGSMTKYGSSFSDLRYGTIGVRRAIREAAADDKGVDGIILRIDSPGGTVSGTADLGDDVAAAAKRKPVVAYVEDMAASAAYWVAAQATTVIANSSALVGSIGTYLAVADYSGLFEERGIKVHVIKAGEMKGAGVPGTEITDAQLADFQRVVEELNTLFVAAVRKGRGLSADETRELADGRVHVAAKALKLGLIDAVGTYDTARKAIRSERKQRSVRMSQETETKAATIQELKAAFPKADDSFHVAQLEKGATLEAARTSYTALLEAKVEADKKAAEEAEQKHKAELEAAAAKTAEAEKKAQAAAEDTGNDVVRTEAGSENGGGNDPAAEFRELVEKKVKGGMTRARAVAEVARDNPKLRHAMVAAANPGKQVAVK